MGACPHDFGMPPPLWCSVSRTERAGEDEEEAVSRRVALTVAMVVALVTLFALSLSAYGEGGRGGGDDEENESASGAPTRNGQIVFRRYFDPEQTKAAIFTMNPDGSHVRQITHPPKGWRDQNPAWSPDGKHVAFYRQRIDEMMSRIMVINPDTGDVREVTHCGPDHGYPRGDPASSGKCVADFQPTWAPDGNSLAFHRILGPDTPARVSDGIWIVGI